MPRRSSASEPVTVDSDHDSTATLTRMSSPTNDDSSASKQHDDALAEEPKPLNIRAFTRPGKKKFKPIKSSTQNSTAAVPASESTDGQPPADRDESAAAPDAAPATTTPANHLINPSRSRTSFNAQNLPAQRSNFFSSLASSTPAADRSNAGQTSLPTRASSPPPKYFSLSRSGSNQEPENTSHFSLPPDNSAHIPPQMNRFDHTETNSPRPEAISNDPSGPPSYLRSARPRSFQASEHSTLLSLRKGGAATSMSLNINRGSSAERQDDMVDDARSSPHRHGSIGAERYAGDHQPRGRSIDEHDAHSVNVSERRQKKARTEYRDREVLPTLFLPLFSLETLSWELY
ncbi:hypothetical protein BOTBODRAFT_32526 [Botryobasidium botryosum FD-172 SS1]|uniref:Uncharacterized protein n=1 Tax=Botryobasidium botryosum (strain FD-172 SS1) TaxID=930990 RepID=A0A067MGW8_BOTB1|nr:hypothetical protein BOTBODRAFT_32526 [Botryobasidium botryosum FD-172 SS1]